MTPALKLGYEHNDNLRMTLQPHNSVTGSTVAPRLDVGVQSDVWRVMGTAEVTRKDYSGEEGLDRDDQSFKLLPQYKTERSTLELTASRTRDAVISGQQEDPDVGFVSAQRVRQTKNIGPAWTWFMTERTQLQLGYQLTEVAYVDGESASLYDYRSRAATASLTYLFSPRDQFFAAAGYSRFRVPALSLESQIPSQNLGVINAVLDVDSRTPSLRMGIGHAFSEAMNGTLMLGARKTSTERMVQTCVPLIFFGGFAGYDCTIFPPGFSSPFSESISDTGTTYSADLKKQFEKLNLSLKASRDISASGAGTEVEADSMSLFLEWPVTARLKGALSADNYEARTVGGTASVNRRLYSVRPRLYWQWTREAGLNFAYNYSHLKRELETRAVQSHAVYLTATYTWPKFSISR